MRTPSLILLIAFVTFMASSLASLFFAHPQSVLPYQLFLMGFLALALVLVLQFRELIELFKTRWHYFTPDRILRAGLLLTLTLLATLASTKSKKVFSLGEDTTHETSHEFLSLVQEQKISFTLIASPTRDAGFSNLMNRFLDRLKSYLPGLEVEIVDPISQPSRVKDIQPIPCLIVIQGDRQMILGRERLIWEESGQNPLFLGEGAITSAIRRLQNPQTLAFYHSAGAQALLHEGPDGFAGLKFILREEGIEILTVSSLQALIQSTASLKMVILNRIQQEVSPQTLEAIHAPTLIALEPSSSSLVSPQPIVDPVRRIQEDPYLIAPVPVPHPITRTLGPRESPIFAGVAHLRPDREERRILQTTAGAWLDTGTNPMLYEPSLEEKGIYRIMTQLGPHILVGDTDWLSNRFLPLPGNRLLLQSTMQILGGRQDLALGMARSIVSRTVKIPDEDIMRYLALTLFVLPFLALGASLILWILRKRA